MQTRILYVMLGLVALILIVRASVFTVSEGQLAIKSTGGEIVDSNFQPGLHFRIPLVNEVTRFDKRILTQMYQVGAFLNAGAGTAHHRFLREVAHQQFAPLLRIDGRKRRCRERAAG